MRPALIVALLLGSVVFWLLLIAAVAGYVSKTWP